MRVHLLDPNGPALLVAAILASSGHEVTASEGAGRLRVRLPGGWLCLELASGRAGTGADLLLCGDSCGEAAEEAPDSSPRLVLRSGAAGPWGLAGGAECAALFDLFADGDGFLELLDSPALLVAPRGSVLAKLRRELAKHGLRLEESRDTAGHVASLLVVRLLDLPAALCNLTRDAFLADGDGRRVALAVLEEGLRVAEKLGLEPAHLGRHDPKDLQRELAARPDAFDKLRQAPGRRYPPVLAALWRGRDPWPLVPQRAFLKRAAEAGVAVDWNRRLAGLLPRVWRGEYLRDPPDLLRAIA